MQWKQIRTEYLRLVQAARKTQRQIAIDGGLSDQNYISKLLNSSDTSLGPHLMNFVGALRGVGVIKVSEFFASIEKQLVGQPPTDPMLVASPAEEKLLRKIGELQLEIYRLATAVRGRPGRRGRPRGKGR